MQSIFAYIRNNPLLRIVFMLLPVAAALSPLAASAAVTAPNIWKTPPGYWGPIVSCTGQYPVGADNSGATTDANGTPYCKDLNDLIQTFVNAVYLLMSFALFIISPLLFVVGAIMIIAAGANPEMLTKGKHTMVGTAIGVIIVLMAYVIVNVIITTLHITGVAGFGS